MLVLLLLILWPVAEVFVAIIVAQSIGVLLTVLLLIASWPLGSWLLRTEGRAALARLRTAVAAGRPPAVEAVDGALVVVGGALLMVPGFITDALGLCLLAPPLRRLAGKVIIRNFRSRVVVALTNAGRRGPRPHDVDSTAHDVDSTAHDVDRPQLRR